MVKLVLKTFGLVFLAEMGDKTQLSTMGLAASVQNGRQGALAVFLGSALALCATSALAAAAGGWISAHVPPRAVKAVSGILFLVFGALFLREAFFGGGAGASGAASAAAGVGVRP